jgi:hypothetical protein
MFHIKVVGKINFFSDNRAANEIISKNVVKPEATDTTADARCMLDK